MKQIVEESVKTGLRREDVLSQSLWIVGTCQTAISLR